MSVLTAKRVIRYHGKEYRPGDELPAHDSAWTASWLDAGSAVWNDPPIEPAPAPTAELIAECREELLTARGTEDADKLPEEQKPKPKPKRTRKRKAQ